MGFKRKESKVPDNNLNRKITSEEREAYKNIDLIPEDSNETPEIPGEGAAMELDEFEEHKPKDEY